MTSTEDESQLRALKTLFAEQKGSHEVVLVIGIGDDKQVIRIPERIRLDEASIKALAAICGDSNIKVTTLS